MGKKKDHIVPYDLTTPIHNMIGYLYNAVFVANRR